MSSSHRFVLRLEGAAVLVAALWAYALLGASWGLFAALLLTPDLSMVGYAWGPRVGAAAYNAVHTYLFPVVLAAVGAMTGWALALPLALIAAAHIGMDRALGYGLKHPTGFHDTHLSAPDREGQPVGELHVATMAR
jgi:hypothetical protein